ncbi:MAG: Sec-independent protein translocase TatC [Cuniculiplasma sp.]
MENGPLKVITSNIDELRFRTIRIVVPILVFFSIFLLFDLRFYRAIVGSYSLTIPYFYPDPYENMGAQFLKLIIDHVITEPFKLLAIKPTDGVVADFYSCLFLAIIFTSPNISYQTGKFIGPALKASEKKIIRTTLLPALVLFLAGSLIGIYFVAPLMFRILYEFDLGVGAQPTMSITSFVSFFFIYVLSFGISFETPVIMVGLTYLAIVPASYWRKNWRYAIVAALIFGVIFSPGVTGFTMMLLAIPIIILYFVGVYASARMEKRKNREIEADLKGPT